METKTRQEQARQCVDTVFFKIDEAKRLVYLGAPAQRPTENDAEALLSGADALLDDALQILDDCRKAMRNEQGEQP